MEVCGVDEGDAEGKMMVYHPYMQKVCAECGERISTILRPCPHCGYQHPLTKAGKEMAKKRKREKRRG